MQAQLKFTNQLPFESHWKKNSLLIYDRALLQQPTLRRWLQKFTFGYAVDAGEELKSVDTLAQHLKKILFLFEQIPASKRQIIVVGGGSVGDFGGFVASILKRGVPLIHIPSTWLAALDSSHGGKTALNVDKTKNQIGTFYPAEKVYLSKKLLFSQPEDRAFEACGEVLKSMLLYGGKLLQFGLHPRRNLAQEIWHHLPLLIAGKNKVVAKDPFEKKGLRSQLNLGHTLGHVLETELELPHGLAVGIGVIFSLSFSKVSGHLSVKEYENIISHPLWGLYLPSRMYTEAMNLPLAQVKKRLLQDKKRSAQNQLKFVFLKKRGQAVVEEIPVDVLLKEYERQGKILRAIYD